MPWEARCPRTRSIMGTPTMGSICLGDESVSGRSLRPLAPDQDDRFHLLGRRRGRRFRRCRRRRRRGGRDRCAGGGGRRRRRRGRAVAPATVVVVDRRLGARQHLHQRGDGRRRRLGQGEPSGPNPAVISWRFTNLRSAGFRVVTPPVSTSSLFFVCVEITQVRAWTTPTLPASGVPDGHFSPFLYSGTESSSTGTRGWCWSASVR